MEAKMIELSFRQFHDGQYRERGYELYVMKNGLGDILYIGISTTDVWGRWFAWGGHMMWDGNVIYGDSTIGGKIENHLPESLDWKIQLWTLKDCLKFCKAELPEDTSNLTIQHVEPIMIRKLSPSLNATHNLNPGRDTTPKSDKELRWDGYVDNAYDEIFNKKK